MDSGNHKKALPVLLVPEVLNIQKSKILQARKIQGTTFFQEKGFYRPRSKKVAVPLNLRAKYQKSFLPVNIGILHLEKISN